ncbi:hypothetical protein [Cryptosporangium sp. NPDC048952]|uniref:hypothetical protein n=1 Tax=Cryptosporangium sp. NPDC048952 TaxID=3363961 RepID=UPI00370FED1C
MPATLAPASVAPGPRGRTRMAVLVGAIAAVLIVVAGVTTTLVLRPGAEPELLRAEPTAAASGAVALGAESDSGGAPSDQSNSDKTAAGPAPAPAETTAEPGTREPGTRKPSATTRSTRSPSTTAPSAPATEAPAAPAPPTKAPAAPAPKPSPTKAPATKAPVKKAPEIDKAVAKSGKRGAGPCSAKLVGGYGCYQTYGDLWWVYDTKGDSHSAVVFWELGTRSGQCANSMGNGTIGACNKNYAEGSTGRAKVCIMDWDTKQMHGCTAYFPFKTS